MTSSPENKITRSDLVKSAVNVGALGMEFSWTYYKQMNIAFCLMVANMLKKIYAGRPDDYAEALHRHCAFFNITVQFAPFVGGIAMAMEEKVARGEIEPESVNDVKAALMGPLSGIGDSIFLSTLRVVAAAVGISLCQAGNPFGPIAFLLIYNVPGFALRVWGAVKGYELGVGFLDEAQRTGLMQKIMTCVGIVGVMVVGAMCKDMFWASIPVAIGSGDDAQTLQDILEKVVQGPQADAAGSALAAALRGAQAHEGGGELDRARRERAHGQAPSQGVVQVVHDGLGVAALHHVKTCHMFLSFVGL